MSQTHRSFRGLQIIPPRAPSQEMIPKFLMGSSQAGLGNLDRLGSIESDSIWLRLWTGLTVSNAVQTVREVSIYRGSLYEEYWGNHYPQSKIKMPMLGLVITCVALFVLGSLPEKLIKKTDDSRWIYVNMSLPSPELPPSNKPRLAARKKSTGGGGGGNQALIPASQGVLPRPNPKPFIAPSVEVSETAKLQVIPEIDVPPDFKLASPDLKAWGDPLSKVKIPSNGPGFVGGIGSGTGGGVGPGKGAGYGPGEGGGVTTRMYRGKRVYLPGGNISAPRLVHSVKPEYTAKAREKGVEGTVTLGLVIDTAGKPRDISWVTNLDPELNYQAIECIKQWRWTPAKKKDGSLVDVYGEIDITFKIL